MITITAGHNPDGKIACGAVGLLKESTENRIIVRCIEEWLKQEAELFENCTVSDGVSKEDILVKCIDKIEYYNACIDLHIHFNASDKHDIGGDGRTKGTEIFMDKKCKHEEKAKNILSRMEKLGFTNRGIKDGSHLYVVRERPETTMLIEVCFVDDHDDVALYNKIQGKEIARQIVSGLLGKEITEEKNEEKKEEKKEEKENAIVLKTLKMKDKGNIVLTAQALLTLKGQKGKNGKVLTLDGKFGENTEHAVKSMQYKYQIPITGKVDYQTWNKLLK